MLDSIIFNEKGVAQLNALKRYCLSGIIVPRQDLFVTPVPVAASITQPGRSMPVPLQGPDDAFSEVYSFSGEQAATFQGIGKITTDGFSVAVVGIGTKFTTQLQVGGSISTAAGSGFVQTITSDTTATTGIAMAANAASDYFFRQNVDTTKLFVSITDQAWRRKLMNRDVPVKHVFGSNEKPGFIKESLLLETNQTLLLEYVNYDTSNATSFAAIAEGRKWQYEAMKSKEVYDYIGGLRERKQYIQPYWLTLDKGFSSLAAGARSVELLTCTGDITLVLFNLYAQAFRTDDGLIDVTNKILVEFTDAKTKRSLQSQPVPLGACAGSIENPFRLSSPLIVEPQTQIQVNFLNTDSSPVNVFLTYHGVAIYTGSSFRGSTLNNRKLIDEAAIMYEAMSTPQIRPASPQ